MEQDSYSKKHRAFSINGSSLSNDDDSQQIQTLSNEEESRHLLGPSRATTHSKRSYCLPGTSTGAEMLNLTRLRKIVNAKNEVDNFQAWKTLIFIFIINANTLASLKIYPIIFEEIVAQNYYTRGQASWPISTASTIQNLAGLLTPLLALKISWRSIEMIQTLLFVVANAGAYFSNGLALDILCIGVIQGVALSIRYNMNVMINNEYFQKYRTTAMGMSLAGSSCGVFVLKPLITHVLNKSNHQFRDAYFALALIMSFNIVFGFFIRKPKIQESEETQRSSDCPDINSTSIMEYLSELRKNPSIHCIWIMQTIYFYISRTYTIFIVDYGVDKGFEKEDSRNLLNFWAYGEIGGRLLLGGFVDSRLLNLKWNIILVNLLLSATGFILLISPSPKHFNITDIPKDGDILTTNYNLYYWFFALTLVLIGAFSSLMNMLIVPFGQKYLGKKSVPWAFALGSIVTSLFLQLRPLLIGLSRDQLKSYDLLIIVMSSGPLVYAFLFLISEPYLEKRRYREIPIVDSQYG